MNGDSAAYFYLACFMICYLGALGVEALSNGWLISYGEKKRRAVRKTCLVLIAISFMGAGISFLIDIFL